MMAVTQLRGRAKQQEAAQKNACIICDVCMYVLLTSHVRNILSDQCCRMYVCIHRHAGEQC